MLVCVFLCIVAHETAGAARTRLSLRPLVVPEGGHRRKARAHRAAAMRTRICCLKIESKLPQRHCEERLRRSNPAFVFISQKLDCFASLAMTLMYPLSFVIGELRLPPSLSRTGA